MFTALRVDEDHELRPNDHMNGAHVVRNSTMPFIFLLQLFRAPLSLRKIDSYGATVKVGVW